jgi:hypothetical protein
MIQFGLQVRKKKVTIATDYNQEFCVADLVEIAGPPANALIYGPGPLLGVVMGKTDREMAGIPLNWSGDFWDVLVGGTVTPISVMWMTRKQAVEECVKA